MSTTSMRVAAALLLGAAAGCVAHAATEGGVRPNVIVVVTDDQGAGDVGCYGAHDLKTPALDGLAAQGVRFTQFYAGAPVCSPSRASLLTGRYPLRAGLANNAASEKGGHGMPAEQVTLAEKHPDVVERLQRLREAWLKRVAGEEASAQEEGRDKAGNEKRVVAYRSYSEMAAAPAVSNHAAALTSGPQSHWFGYYDKEQLDASGRYLLALRTSFEHRLPKPGEAAEVGMLDLQDGNRWIALGESRAWCWQQGCMLQWRPGHDGEAVWNDREGDRFVSRVLNVRTRAARTLPRAIGHLSPDGRTAVCEDFSRAWDFRPGYGYPGLPDPYAAQAAPAEVGVWRMDLETGETRLLVSLDALAKIPYEKQRPADKHYVNHLAWSPDGSRFLLFDRWSGAAGMPTRVFTLGADGQELRLLSARDASHYAWRDPEHVLIWTEGAYKLYRDNGSGEPCETLWQAPNGHQSYVPGTRGEWLVTDTYDRLLYLVHLPSGSFVPLGRYPQDKAYTGEWRCDLHPRVSRDGRWVFFDSPHAGNGRQLYRVDIGEIVGHELDVPNVDG